MKMLMKEFSNEKGLEFREAMIGMGGEVGIYEGDDMLKIGIKGEIRRKVTADMTAKHVGSGELDVLATPVLISVAEECAWKSIVGYLEEGKGSVGTKIDLSHMSASPIGVEIRCETELIEVDRRRMVFAIRAYDDVDKIAEGIHERFVIDNEAFTRKAAEKTNI